MVTQYGMCDKLGPLAYGDNEEEVFLGHSIARTQNLSDETQTVVDEEIHRLVDEGFERRRRSSRTISTICTRSRVGCWNMRRCPARRSRISCAGGRRCVNSRSSRRRGLRRLPPYPRQAAARRRRTRSPILAAWRPSPRLKTSHRRCIGQVTPSGMPRPVTCRSLANLKDERDQEKLVKRLLSTPPTPPVSENKPKKPKKRLRRPVDSEANT